jgi:hypothetical protein
MGRLPGSIERRRFTQQLDQLLVYDLDHLLRWRQALHHLDANRARFDPLDKVLDNLVVDICFEQRQPHFAHGGVDVGFRQLALGGKPVEDTL